MDKLFYAEFLKNIPLFTLLTFKDSCKLIKISYTVYRQSLYAISKIAIYNINMSLITKI